MCSFKFCGQPPFPLVIIWKNATANSSKYQNVICLALLFGVKKVMYCESLTQGDSKGNSITLDTFISFDLDF